MHDTATDHDRWLAEHTFQCDKMRGRLTPEQCERNRRAVAMRAEPGILFPCKHCKDFPAPADGAQPVLAVKRKREGKNANSPWRDTQNLVPKAERETMAVKPAETPEIRKVTEIIKVTEVTEMAKHAICVDEGCEKYQVKNRRCTLHSRAFLAAGNKPLTRKQRSAATAPAPGKAEREPLPASPLLVSAAPQKTVYDRGAFRRNVKQFQIHFLGDDAGLYDQIIEAAKASRRQPMQEVLFRLERDMRANG